MVRLTTLCSVLLALTALPLAAQSLPDWAAPQPPPSAPSYQEPAPMEAGPTLPSSPDQVPVDGGLGLLALAGAGYAARKLRQQRTL